MQFFFFHFSDFARNLSIRRRIYFQNRGIKQTLKDKLCIFNYIVNIFLQAHFAFDTEYLDSINKKINLMFI